MTQALSLRRTGNTEITLDLLALPLSLIEGTLEERSERDGLITVSFKIGGKATNAQVIDYERQLAQIREAARLYVSDRLRNDAAWIYEKAEGEAEPNGRRSFIFSLDYRISEAAFQTRLLGREGIVIDIVLTRHPLWETVTGFQETIAGSAPAQGSNIVRVNIPLGMQSSRIHSLWIEPESGWDANSYTTKYWVGIRQARFGYSSLKFVWEAESGTLLTDATLDSQSGCFPIGSASNNKVRIDFSTQAGMVDRVKIRLGDIVGSNYNHFIGRYLVMARIGADAGTYYLKLKSGYSNSQRPFPEVPLTGTNTAYRLIELGEVTIGGRDGLISPEFSFWLAAERASGSGWLHFDALCLLPIDGYAIAAGSEVTGTTRKVYFYTYEDDTTAAVGYDGTTPITALDCRMDGIEYPPDGAIFTYYQERYDTNLAAFRHEIADAGKLNMGYYYRFKDYLRAWP